MMTSMGGNRARGSWEQTQGQTQSQTQHKQRPQATAEQIRLAQMISDHNDADFEEKVKQLIDITGKDQDESMIALHDCNGDVNRAINVLLEGSPDTDSWEMVGKKKGVSGQKETSQAETGEEGKENREKGGEKDVARRRGGAPRKGRGASRGREFRGQENGLDGSKAGVAGRGAERGRRGRGRGRGTVGVSGRRGGRFSAQGMGQIDKGPRYDIAGGERTFNPADYAEPAQTEENYGGGSTWNNTGSVELEEGARLEYSAGEGTNYPPKFDSAPGAWRTATEEWGTEDWNEDLSETKIFTASSVASMPLPQENVTITKGQRIDLAVLLGKTPPSSSSETENPPMEATQPPSLSQSLVFSNSKQGVPLSQTSSSTPYTQHNMVSMLSKGFGDVGDPKGGSTGTTGSQFLEQYKTAQALAQLAAQHSQTGPPNTNPSSWDTSATSLGQYDMKSQPESAVHTPFTKRQPYQAATSTSSMLDVFLQDKGLPPSSSSSSLPQQTTSSPHGVPPPASSLPKMTAVPSLGQQVSPSSSDAQSPLPLQQHKLKQQKKRTSITTKIPAMAVEMPGSTDISGLNLQFGALQFGSEPVLPEYESAPTTATPANQVQNSLYTCPNSESTPALSNSSQMDLYDQRATQTRRYPPSVSSSPQKDMQPKNGFSSIQATQSVEAAAGSAVSVKQASDSVTQASVSSMGTLTDSPASLLTASNQTSLSALGHSEDLPPSTIPPPQHNNSHPSQQNSLAPSSVRTSNSSLLHPNVDGDSSLHSSFPSSVSAVPSSSVPSSSSSVAAAQVSLGAPQASSVGSATVSAPSGLGPVSSLAMGLNTASMGAPAVAAATVSVSTTGSAIPSSATSSSTRGSAASSGKAPPNLPPGVPPLLPNPYIMAPGLLHAYPPQVYGYDDLQMLQTRIPLDYYSIPFATPTTALTGREGSLTSNPYSGDLSKFGRGDASSPAPATTLAQTQQNQTQTHHTTQQPFLNPALPPGYSYTSLPYYTGMPGLPNTFQYGPAVFPVAPTSSKQHGVNVGVNASATPFQQASGYGSHGYSTGYEDVGQASGSGDFCKGGYGTAVAAAASAQNKPASSVTGPGVGVSVTSSNTGVPDISGSVYTKTQSFEKQGFHAGTPAASFSLPSALGSGGPINAPAAAGYAPAPFMHILAPHQQPHSQILHHHLQQDGQSGTGQRSQNASIQQKSQINKSAYNSYNWGAN
ncbi:ubiquitin-associated protein 2-like isoform X1 [Acanthopagrus latus]|uniref:ubiquitin-associated protein 2-like isoform X1 n=1 Tax=Acanthopagrus latus TaxID=8177 RepID=UPI00187CD29C|nr:ubiquitin-associated protein 2-like isoform X1 [Acanthopagrus latus]XP_036948429.1 ubiquitin-associated protein 2-like isoform X1 [Acanthopagrus latus]XP_036948430.1 ubiquitin-associated protein 2-like isoform X1 [Acanthopagrus latus]XP_036948431.1 ubiquitin-associated protein 2-like isoform X1 [Acanthopagrus latus]